MCILCIFLIFLFFLFSLFWDSAPTKPEQQPGCVLSGEDLLLFMESERDPIRISTRELNTIILFILLILFYIVRFYHMYFISLLFILFHLCLLYFISSHLLHLLRIHKSFLALPRRPESIGRLLQLLGGLLIHSIIFIIILPIL